MAADCDFIGKHNICIHPVLKGRKGRKCVYVKMGVSEEWRCFFRLPRKKGEEDG